MSDKVLVGRAGPGVMEITLNRVERKNALDLEMYEALVDAFSAAAEDDATSVLLVTGAQGVFCAGNDLADFLRHPPEGEHSPVMRFLRALLDFPKFLVAAVDGPAVGIGTTMLLHCDLAYAAPTALFKMPFVNLGIVPEAGSSFLVPRLVGHRRAVELLVLGESFGGEEAKAMGFVNDVVAASELLAVARRGCAKLAALPPSAARAASKALLKAPFRDELARIVRIEGDEVVERLRGPEAKEALTAFVERRAPDFSKLG